MRHYGGWQLFPMGLVTTMPLPSWIFIEGSREALTLLA